MPATLVFQTEIQPLCDTSPWTYDSESKGPGTTPGMGGNGGNLDDEDEAGARTGSLWEDFGFNEEF